MNTITYYDIINDTTATLEFRNNQVVPCAVKMLEEIVKPIHYYVDSIEITNENIIVYKDGTSKPIIISYDVDRENWLKYTLKRIYNRYNSWVETEKEKKRYYKIAIEFSEYDEDDEASIKPEDFLENIIITNYLNHPFDDLYDLSSYLFNEANFQKGYIEFGDSNNISFQSIQYKKFYGVKNKKCCIHVIKRINEYNETVDILFSDGICTSNMTHISGETQKWFNDCKLKIDNLEQEAIKHFDKLFAY